MKNSYEPRLKTAYKASLKDLQKQLGLDNVNQVPKLVKVVVSSGTGKHKEDKKYLEVVKNTITKITGQMPTGRIAKKSIASFHIRAGLGAPLGYVVTLRDKKAYEFLDRLISVVLPQVRDFHGVKSNFDGQGNYNLGITEQSVFPELSFEELSVLHGIEITIVVKNGSKEATKALLTQFGMPFEKKGEK
ncbi:MAG: 50S ribosomal protein L5 [Candidatus Nomurabacteria bacterium]|jgi:large subunit ribosomal protein L5|nr:50S ribosomal protein L5 [Candidatus Nomurabacteria bacterium]